MQVKVMLIESLRDVSRATFKLIYRSRTYRWHGLMTMILFAAVALSLDQHWEMLGRVAFVCRSCRQAGRNGTIKRRKVNQDGTKAYSTASTRQQPLHLAIIGSGPAGFYSAYRLLKALPDARIDMYEGLPSPYGLVRFGIAPDHPEAKV